MDYIIREMHPNEYPLLEDFLYQAIYQPDKTNLASKSIINKPELQVYIKDFSTRKDDYCFCAEVNGKVVGAVWVRNINGYGSVEMLRNDFINNFSHEFKTPIVSIRGFAKMLQNDDLKTAYETLEEISADQQKRLGIAS